MLWSRTHQGFHKGSFDATLIDIAFPSFIPLCLAIVTISIIVSDNVLESSGRILGPGTTTQHVVGEFSVQIP